MALWLAVRKQRSTELDLLQKHEPHRLAEQVAADTRQHQLRTAADAREDALARRVIAEVLCAYLRMPPGSTAEEVQVRRAAQKILERHTHPGDIRHWPGLFLDFSGAHLDRVRFTGCRFEAILFTGFASFISARFDGEGNFQGAQSADQVDFHNARFVDDVNFGDAEFAALPKLDQAEAGPDHLKLLQRHWPAGWTLGDPEDDGWAPLLRTD
ncbi:hypothetical protein A4R44_01616 [Amycolatopsis sp. M39]|nr:hypothetical protein A4R44_01616 [Amycolatopsis sp. M39]